MAEEKKEMSAAKKIELLLASRVGQPVTIKELVEYSGRTTGSVQSHLDSLRKRGEKIVRPARGQVMLLEVGDYISGRLPKGQGQAQDQQAAEPKGKKAKQGKGSGMVTTLFSGSLEPDEEYRRECEQAHKVYLQRLGEADELMARVTVSEFTERMMAGLDVIPETHAYERFASDELEGTLRAAAARMFMRKLCRGTMQVG